MQAVVELPLEAPGELAVLDFPGLKHELIVVDFHVCRFEADANFDPLEGRSRVKGKERMFVSLQLALDFAEEFTHWGDGGAQKEAAVQAEAGPVAWASANSPRSFIS